MDVQGVCDRHGAFCALEGSLIRRTKNPFLGLSSMKWQWKLGRYGAIDFQCIQRNLRIDPCLRHLETLVPVAARRLHHLAAESGGFDVAKSKGVAWQANA